MIAAKAEKESHITVPQSGGLLRLGGEPMRVIDVFRLRLSNSVLYQRNVPKRPLLSALVQEGVAVDPADWRESWHE